ncbi:MAG: IS66 family insertion sequence element accessory protein TnpB [Phycisphaerae bacterium]|nr:IS66 family insertion sequence element accessory protein TnpB [Phycisphaerae bacterium]
MVQTADAGEPSPDGLTGPSGGCVLKSPLREICTAGSVGGLGGRPPRSTRHRLAEQSQQVTRRDPQSGHLFVFRSRRGDRLKALYWDKDGYVLVYKRLEEGTFKLPKLAADQESVELKASELAMLLDGIDLSSVKRVKRYKRACANA